MRSIGKYKEELSGGESVESEKEGMRCVVLTHLFAFINPHKLKQTWVENKKIKSKWKAQKRKEGLLSTAHIVEGKGSDNEEKPESGSESEQEEVEKEQSSEPEEKPAPAPTPKKSTLHPSRAHIHPELAPKNSRRRRKIDEEIAAADPPLSLRDLTRQAYSKSTLHTFKADSSHRGGARGRGRGRGRGGRGGQGETGRGQPNMKLRMDAMLEKIKQTMQ
ncbi:hypothetical protein H0H81_000666 [Sphagnurus paluster]|uniref:Uncharacterized protein n=1 Tax=Sphagnurus paluster TaxID=117069 RepID=A0A9P7K5W5_9AGAR|nr:hypothetical protein H0H81_000666 [Sphagnurus paluster]